MKDIVQNASIKELDELLIKINELKNKVSSNIKVIDIPVQREGRGKANTGTGKSK